MRDIIEQLEEFLSTDLEQVTFSREVAKSIYEYLKYAFKKKNEEIKRHDKEN